MNNALSPIVLFVYNRPWHTRKCLEALEKNNLAQESVLYIYADGAKEKTSKQDLQSIAEVRKLIRLPWKLKEIHLIEREKNWGLADSIIAGVTAVVNQHEKVIVLEDDIVASQGFLTYMNEALNLYQNEDKVMHISGYIPNLGAGLPDTYFYNQASCWGWATWKKAWQQIELDAHKLLKEVIKQKRMTEFDLEGAFPFSGHLLGNIEGKIKTWAIKWHASIFLQRGLCLHPAASLTQNIGNDSSGTNSARTSVYDTAANPPTPTVHRIELIESQEARNRMIRFNYQSGFRARPLSPLTQQNKVKQIRSISTQKISEDYLKTYQIEVSHFFENMPQIFVFECLDTGYQFYYPFQVAGDTGFYEKIQQKEGYYMPWKWPHEQATKLLRPALRVLEIGCKQGDFLAKIKNQHQAVVTGLELHPQAATDARAKGLHILEESIHTHAAKKPELYDVVCCFEVLEHIAEVKDFLHDALTCLKSSGKLVIAVPDNQSFLKYLPMLHTLNMPPHHMGLWNKKALKNLVDCFPISLDTLINEPLQPYHKEWRNYITKSRFHDFMQKNLPFYQLLPKAIKRPLNYGGERIAKAISSKKGHTIVAIYTKK